MVPAGQGAELVGHAGPRVELQHRVGGDLAGGVVPGGGAVGRKPLSACRRSVSR